MSLAVLAAIKSLAAPFTDAPIAWPNEAFTLPTDDYGSPLPWIWAETNGLGATLIGLGSENLSEDHGFVRFHVMVPVGSGLEGATGLADTLSALYRAQNPISGLQLLAPSPPEFGASSDDGLYFGVSFSVPWTYWHS